MAGRSFVKQRLNFVWRTGPFKTVQEIAWLAKYKLDYNVCNKRPGTAIANE